MRVCVYDGFDYDRVCLAGGCRARGPFHVQPGRLPSSLILSLSPEKQKRKNPLTGSVSGAYEVISNVLFHLERTTHHTAQFNQLTQQHHSTMSAPSGRGMKFFYFFDRQRLKEAQTIMPKYTLVG